MRLPWFPFERQVAAACLLVIAAGCDFPGRPDPADRPILPDQVRNFETLFSAHCAGCHGDSGEYGPAPPLNDSLFASLITDEELLGVIRHGRSGTPMPGFARQQGGLLTSQQIEILATGIKEEWGGADTTSTPPYALPSVADTSATTGDIAHGRELFASACAGCHGTDGIGDDVDPRDSINVPAFLSLISDQALRRIIITGRSDLGMPDYASSDGRSDDFRPLTSSDIDDLVALLAEWRRSISVTTASNNSNNNAP